MPKQPLGQAAQDLIHEKVDELFKRLKAKFLGPNAFRGDKGIVISAYHDKVFTLPGVLQSASALEGVRADPGTEDTLVKLASQYLDATRELTKAKVVRAVTTFLTQSQLSTDRKSV